MFYLNMFLYIEVLANITLLTESGTSRSFLANVIRRFNTIYYTTILF